MEECYIRDIELAFPYPIASAFRWLLAEEYSDPGSPRLDQILATAEAISRFLGMVVLCECRDYAEDRGGAPPLALSGDFERQFRRPSWGSWLYFAREGLKWLNKAGVPGLLVVKLVDFYFERLPKESKAAQALGELVTLRNGLEHGKIQLRYPHQFRKHCEEFYPRLEVVLEALAFLLDYELNFVSQIEVRKRRKKDPSYEHRFVKIRGADERFGGGPCKLSTALDSQTVILREPRSGHYLDLDPLLVREAEAAKAVDIFFYNGMKDHAVVEYAACKHGGAFESSHCERADEIAEEMQHLLHLLSPVEEPVHAG